MKNNRSKGAFVSKSRSAVPSRAKRAAGDWFHHHGDELDGELKHIRNALAQVLASACRAATVQRDAQHVALLASAHRLIRAERKTRRQTDTRQLSLF